MWLFKPGHESGWDANEDHLVRMTETLDEKFPLDMLAKCEHRGKYFKEDGECSVKARGSTFLLTS